jgi:class 3 adenylate cyclase
MLLRKFEGDLEDRFRAQYAEHSVPFIRVALPIAIALYLFFLAWDYSISPSQVPYTFLVRMAFCVIALAVFALTFHPVFKGREQPILCTTLVLGAAGVLGVLYMLPHGFTYGIAGVLLVIMYAFGFFRLLFNTALVACIAILAIANALIYLQGNELFVYLNSNFFLFSASVIGLSCAFLLEWMARRAFHFEHALMEEKEASDAMLRSFLPARIVDRLKNGDQMIAESTGEATVLFADIVGFTSLAGRLAPGHLVEMLSEIFTMLDEIAEEERVEKVKTIGDSYMVVAGVHEYTNTSAKSIAEFALRSMEAVNQYAEKHGLPLRMTMGMSTGSVVSGVIGSKVPIFDLWGETVNLASRLQTEGVEGCIQVSESTYWRLHNEYEFEERGKITVKGNITLATFLLKGRKRPDLGGFEQFDERRKRLEVVS